MRVLIATDPSGGSSTGGSVLAGPRPAIEGELVAPDRTSLGRSGDRSIAEHVAALVEGPVGGPAEPWIGGWVGLVSRGPTMHAMVAERPGVTPRDLRARLREWIEACGTCSSDDPIEVLVEAHLAELTEVCLAFPIGTIVSRRNGGIVSVRRNAA